MTEIEIDKAFELIAFKNENIPIYKHEGNYYVVFNYQDTEGYLAFKLAGDADNIEYEINPLASPLPGNKIDYAKLPLMEGITTMTFGADGTAHLDITKAMEIPTVPVDTLTPVDTPVLQEAPPVMNAEGPQQQEEENLYIPRMVDGQFYLPPLPESYIPESAGTPTEQPVVETKPRVVETASAKPTGVKVTLTTQAQFMPEPEGVDEPEDDLDDFLADLFAVGEITAMETVRGTKVQTLEINVNSIKSLLSQTENEFLNEVQNRFIVNMNKIAQLRRENDTIGKTILNIKGLPSWMVPVVEGEFKPVEKATEQVTHDVFQLTAQPDSCQLILDQQIPPMYSSYEMDTDKDNIPGSWLKTRTDFTVNAAYKNPDGKFTSLKLPGNNYQATIQLTESAMNRMLEQQAKILRKPQSRGCARPSMYVRLLTVPKAIKSVDINLVGTERVATINGFIIREPGSSSKPISSKEQVVKISCKSTEAHRSTLENTINSVYPTVDRLLGESTITATNTHAYLNMLKWYQYERNDVTLSDWKIIGKMIKKNLSSERLDLIWAAKHSRKISDLSRAKFTEEKKMIPADNGKYQLCVDLQKYMDEIKDMDIQIPSTTPSESTELTVKTPRYNNITNDPVHGLLFRSDVTGKFYTAEAYKRQLRHQLWSRIRDNLESEKATVSCDTLKLILKDLEHYRWQTTKGMLENLKIKLTGTNLVSSSMLNLLTSFNTGDMIGQVSFIRHMDMFIENGHVRLNPFTKQYYIQQTKEAVCCQHVLEDLKEHSLADFMDANGKCKHCLATIENDVQADDFGQTQFSTARDMYTTGGEESPDTDPEHATLKYFLGHCLKWLAPQLQESGVVLSLANTEQIIEDTMEYIIATNPVAAKPYGPLINTKPVGWTPDLRMAILYDQQIVERSEGEQSERVIMRKKADTGRPTGTKSFFRVLAYFRENESDSTTDAPQAIAPRLRGKLMDMMMNPVKAFPMLHNMLVMNRLTYNLGVLIAHLNLTVNLEYSNTENLSFLLNEKNLYDICNTFQPLMRVIIETHIKNLRTSDKESQTIIMPYFDSYKNMFTEEFSKDLYAVGFTSRIPAEERATDSFNKMYETLQRQNASWYDAIIEGDRDTGFAKYEASRSMVPQALINNSPPSAPAEVSNMSSYIDCWSNNLLRGAVYGDLLWQQYADINKGLPDVPLSKKLSPEAPSLEIETFQASVCSSKVLLMGSILSNASEQDNIHQVIRDYMDDEDLLDRYRQSKLQDLERIDEELCQFGLAVPRFNSSLQSNQVYYPCNPTQKGRIENVVTQLRQEDTDSILRPELTGKRFLDNMRVLMAYKSMDGYAGALDGEIFRRSAGTGVSRINYLTNDIAAINPGSVATVINNEWHKLIHDRRYVPGLDGSLPVPENIDEVPDFNDDFPSLTGKSQRADDDTINRRRIFRIQNNGRSVINMIQWISKDLPQEYIMKLKEKAEGSKQVTNGTYSIEKEIISMDGYILEDVLDLLLEFRTHIGVMRLTDYHAIIPEIYEMSYLEYSLIMEHLDLPDEKNLTSFRDTIYAAIRLDLILHVKGLQLDQSVKSKLNMDILDDIHDFAYRKEGTMFISMVTRLMNALANVNIDPNVESINKLYEARQMERITISMATRQKEQTLFQFAEMPQPEQVVAENDPQDDEEEGDVDDDGQPTNRIAPREGDEDDGFDVNDDPGEENWDDDGNNLAGGNDHDGD